MDSKTVLTYSTAAVACVQEDYLGMVVLCTSVVVLCTSVVVFMMIVC